MIYHIVVGDIAGDRLKETIMNEPSMAGEVIVLKDILHVGPIQKAEGQTFSETRSAFWNEVINNDKHPVHIDDMERLLEVSKQMFEDDSVQAWYWMAPWPADVTGFHWVLPYLGKHLTRFYLINIAGLPFLDENGKVFYPKSFGEILPKEIIKARRLARLVTPAEVEVDGEEWRKLVEENSGIRIHEGGKKLKSVGEDYYDNQLASFCSHQYQKASKIVSQALNKFRMPTGDVHLGWRLRKMAEEGKLQLQGDTSKQLKDFEVKLPGGDGAAEPTPNA
jgi:hypothetical protein